MRAARQVYQLARVVPAENRGLPRVEVTIMTQDLAALAPSAIVCVAFLIGAWMLLRRELGSKRRARAKADVDAADERDGEQGEGSET